MNEPDDPVRLLDDPGTSHELRSLLVAGRADAIDRAGVARVQARVQERLAAPPLSRRWWGIGVGTAAIVGWLAVRGSAADASSEPELASPIVTESTVAAAIEPTPRRVTPPPSTIEPMPAKSPVVAPVAREPRRSTRVVAPPPEPSTPTNASEEARLLLAARRALARDPATALARADEHARRFADSTLAEERELVAVRALVALDRGTEAQARAARFTERFPGSVHASALARALE